MYLIEKLRKIVSDPARAAYTGLGKISPTSFGSRYSSLSHAAGFNHLYLVISLDCDTADDIRVVEKVHNRLVNMGAKPVYAVPGSLLQRGEAIYRALFESGAEFINHGFTEHTYYDSQLGVHASCFFYDKMTIDSVRRDIEKGDDCLRKTLGVIPRGFRAPHFGTFQKHQQLSALHTILAGMGYQFSTSTLPYYAMRYGPAFRHFGLMEFPVSGKGSSPVDILDSWGCFAAPHRKLSAQDYAREGQIAASAYAQCGVGLLNYYADPYHIHDQELFYQTVATWLEVAQAVNFQELLTILPSTPTG